MPGQNPEMDELDKRIAGLADEKTEDIAEEETKHLEKRLETLSKMKDLVVRVRELEEEKERLQNIIGTVRSRCKGWEDGEPEERAPAGDVLRNIKQDLQRTALEGVQKNT